MQVFAAWRIKLPERKQSGLGPDREGDCDLSYCLLISLSPQYSLSSMAK